MRRLSARAAILAATSLFSASTAPAQESQPSQLQTRAEGFSGGAVAQNDCTKLGANAGPAAAKFAQLKNGPVTIISAKVVPAGGDGKVGKDDLPEHCRVIGSIPPNVGFMLRMPTKNWNGKFMMGGCGGPCGNFLEDRIDPALVRNYAVVTTDMGHKGVGWAFGYQNFMGMADFGYRATHITADVAKAVVAEFYGKKASRNYYFGCSTGGRQGMVAAERFPWDFDVIAAGALPWNQTGYDMLNRFWPAQANTRPDGSLILSQSQLPTIHKAVMAKCDALDGWKDGILQNPLACSFKAADLICKAGQSSDSCLTAEQAVALQKIYDGPLTQAGGPRYYLGQGGLAMGSELKWRDLGPWKGGENSMAKYFDVFSANGARFNDSAEGMMDKLRDLNATEWIFSPMNHDLRNFRAAGGKLILFHGWDDGVPVRPSIEYYEAASRLMGGPEKTKEFFRMFLAGGMDHCRGGEGGGEVDWITAMEQWDAGTAPEALMAYHYTDYRTSPRDEADYGAPYLRTARHPLKPDEYDRAHPLYPYPDWPVWTGKGDPNDPATWTKSKNPVRISD